VRTGLAWATLAGGGGGWGLDAADGPDADGGAERGRCGDWRDPAALALLRRAAKRRGGAGGGAAGGAAWPGAADVSLQLATYAYGAPRGGERGGAGAPDERAGGAGADAGLELFIRRSSEAWQLSSLEADRKRLVAVAERLVQLGAAVAAVDAEGRTALHLVRAGLCASRTEIPLDSSPAWARGRARRPQRQPAVGAAAGALAAHQARRPSLSKAALPRTHTDGAARLVSPLSLGVFSAEGKQGVCPGRCVLTLPPPRARRPAAGTRRWCSSWCSWAPTSTAATRWAARRCTTPPWPVRRMLPPPARRRRRGGRPACLPLGPAVIVRAGCRLQHAPRAGAAGPARRAGRAGGRAAGPARS